MSTTHGQPGLSSDQRSAIRSTILSTRHTLEDELRLQLEKYGIYDNKRHPLEELSHLSAEERHTRRTLDAAIERELESTEGDLERSITNYVREATKTYLNRFVALKTIEVRGLVEETITERPEYGNRSYMHHTVAEIAGELTNAPDDGFGAALDIAYKEIGAEIRMIFEESEHTAIDLDAQVREEVLDELDAIDDEAWESDEALGWVYQYFGEEEREEIDERVDEENYKIAGTDIATKTQLFTPRYIVEWMVDNSLGRLWLEMQDGRTNISDEDNCFYLAPLEESLIDRETKPVEEITVLDPACGSGHMLFYAFDVLYQMYLEEGEVPEKYIPREILRNNLYGIDIDTGAAQIAALSLYLKAKEKAPGIDIAQMNIISADAVLINGERKQEVLEGAQSELEVEILEQIWQSFRNIREWGSLVRVEDQVDKILEEHRETFESEGQTQFTLEGELTSQSTFITSGEEETWAQLKERLMLNIRELAETALEHDDLVEELFAGEIERSVRLLDLFLYDYDVVVSNPPYLGSGKMNDSLKQFVKDNYLGSRDLYTAFIERNRDFAVEEGYVSMITMETFMYLYSFRKMRPELLETTNFVDVAHFENRDEGYMNVGFCFRKSLPENHVVSRFNRLVNMDDKVRGLHEIVESHRRNDQHDNAYVVDQHSFTEIGRNPFIYWFGRDILGLFTKRKQLDDISDVVVGLQTSDDERFVRKWWEIERTAIDETYAWYALGGDDTEYYDSTESVIYWEDNGQEVINYEDSYPRNREYYGKRGINFKKFSKYFLARYHPEGNIFSDATRLVYSNDEATDMYLLGYLNSNLARYIMDGINPSINFQAGDAKRLPVSDKSTRNNEIKELSEFGMLKQKELSEYDETKIEFDIDPSELDNVLQLLRDQELIDSDIKIVHGLIDEHIFSEYEIPKPKISEIYDNFPENLAEYPHIENAGELDTDESRYRAEISTETLSGDDYKKLIERIDKHKGQSLREISEELSISPHTVAMARYDHGLYTSEEKERAAGLLLSYYIGSALGRWQFQALNTVDDGILVFDNEVMETIRECIKLSFDEVEADRRESEISRLLGRDIDDWIRNRFFRYHHCKEYRRRGQRIPVYWQLESPSGAFSCFIYYHEIDANTLPKLRGQYLDPRIDELENELETLNAQTSGDNPDKKLLDRKEKVQNDLDDIKEFRETIDEMIDDGVTINLEKGIWENIKKWDQYEVLETGLPKLKSSYSR